tara:strand:+ start:204 stop:827 length:624 start_codon:yes stop_codon:yes gene_type:complete
MTIQIKKSIKPVNYSFAINTLEKRVEKIINNQKVKELIWFLEHPSIYTGGSSYKRSEILDNSIKLIKTKRGGKITWHGPGQLICYLVIDLKKRDKDIRRFVNLLELSIINSLKEYKINSFSDRKNIGIWSKLNNKKVKIGAIGIRVKRWVAYHGFSLNISNDLNNYKKIVPCGLDNYKVNKLSNLKKQNYKNIRKILEKNILSYLKV